MSLRVALLSLLLLTVSSATAKGNDWFYGQSCNWQEGDFASWEDMQRCARISDTCVLDPTKPICLQACWSTRCVDILQRCDSCTTTPDSSCQSYFNAACEVMAEQTGDPWSVGYNIPNGVCECIVDSMPTPFSYEFGQDEILWFNSDTSGTPGLPGSKYDQFCTTEMLTYCENTAEARQSRYPDGGPGVIGYTITSGPQWYWSSQFGEYQCNCEITYEDGTTETVTVAPVLLRNYILRCTQLFWNNLCAETYPAIYQGGDLIGLPGRGFLANTGSCACYQSYYDFVGMVGGQNAIPLTEGTIMDTSAKCGPIYTSACEKMAIAGLGALDNYDYEVVWRYNSGVGDYTGPTACFCVVTDVLNANAVVIDFAIDPDINVLIIEETTTKSDLKMCQPFEYACLYIALDEAIPATGAYARPWYGPFGGINGEPYCGCTYRDAGNNIIDARGPIIPGDNLDTIRPVGPVFDVRWCESRLGHACNQMAWGWGGAQTFGHDYTATIGMTMMGPSGSEEFPTCTCTIQDQNNLADTTTVSLSFTDMSFTGGETGAEEMCGGMASYCESWVTETITSGTVNFATTIITHRSPLGNDFNVQPLCGCFAAVTGGVNAVEYDNPDPLRLSDVLNGCATSNAVLCPRLASVKTQLPDGLSWTDTPMSLYEMVDTGVPECSCHVEEVGNPPNTETVAITADNVDFISAMDNACDVYFTTWCMSQYGGSYSGVWGSPFDSIFCGCYDGVDFAPIQDATCTGTTALPTAAETPL